MTIDWNIVAMIAAPLIAGVAGAALNHWLEGRPRLISYIGHVPAHRILYVVRTFRTERAWI